MKPLKKMLAYIIAFFFAMIPLSCSKSDRSENTPTPSVNMKLIEEIEASPRHIIRLSLETLSPEEKLVLWQRHLKSKLNDPQISSSLKAHISKLTPLLTVNFFRNVKNNDSKIFMERFTKEWFTDPVNQGLFDKDELLEASTVFGMGHEMLNPPTKSGVTPLSEILTPQSCTCYYSMSCDGVYTCNTGGCTRGGSCGIFGSSNCDGTCS